MNVKVTVSDFIITHKSINLEQTSIKLSKDDPNVEIAVSDLTIKLKFNFQIETDFDDSNHVGIGTVKID